MNANDPFRLVREHAIEFGGPVQDNAERGGKDLFISFNEVFRESLNHRHVGQDFHHDVAQASCPALDKLRPSVK
jgi:hypothetical protein